jgi:hypothetical protein
MGGLFTVNMVTTNSVLLYISYPVQVIGRNIRFLFVVIIGAFFSRVKKTNTHLILGKHKIFIALIITAGVISFNFAKDVTTALLSPAKTRPANMIPIYSGLVICYWVCRCWWTHCFRTARLILNRFSSLLPINCSL